MIITLINSFHNTNTKVKVTKEQYQEWTEGLFDYVIWLYQRIYDSNDKNAKRQMHKIWKKLCGIKDCNCGITRPQ